MRPHLIDGDTEAPRDMRLAPIHTASQWQSRNWKLGDLTQFKAPR